MLAYWSRYSRPRARYPALSAVAPLPWWTKSSANVDSTRSRSKSRSHILKVTSRMNSVASTSLQSLAFEPGRSLAAAECGFPYRDRRPKREQSMAMPPTVLIVDDHAGFRASARRMLSAHDYDVVAEAESGEEALEIARTLRPASILLDIGLPDLDGVEVARRLSEAQPEVAIVLVSSHDRADLEPVL